MSNVKDFDVVISASGQAGQAGSWFPLIYIPNLNQEIGSPTYEEFSSFTELATKYPKDGIYPDAYSVAKLLFTQDEEGRPSKVAVVEGAEDVISELPKVIEKDWRQLIVAGKPFDKSVADYIETTEKLYFTNTVSAASSVAIQELRAAKVTDYERTVCVVYAGQDLANPEAALVGATAGYEAGSFTYHSIVLKGLAADTFTSVELEEIKKAGGNCYVMKNGKVASHGGIVGNGEWIDVIDSKDWLIQNIRYDVNEVNLNNKKVPYTDAGISKYASATRNRLAIAYKMGMIAEDENGQPLYSVSFKKRNETTSAERVSRTYEYGYFEAELSGAIHNGKIKGLVIA